MKKKLGFKAITVLMLVTLLPMNFSNVITAVEHKGVTTAALKSSVNPKGVAADTVSSTGASRTFAGQTITQPDAANTTYNFGYGGSATNPVLNSARPNIGTGAFATNDGSTGTNTATNAMAPDSFGYQASVGGIVTDKHIQVVDNGAVVFDATSISEANVAAALSYMANSGSSSDDYVLFIGGAVTLSSTTCANTGAAGTFSGLKGKVKSLTIVANATDSLTSATTSAASGNYTITTPSNVYLGAPTVFRNVTVSASGDKFYAQGNAFATTVGSSITGGANIYGGADGTSTLNSDTNIYLGAYVTGNWNVYGGNADVNSANAADVINGNTHVTIAGLNGGSISTLTGGSGNGGTINGSTNLTVSNMSGQITTIYGAGLGSSSLPNTVTGNSYTTLNSSNAGVVYSDIWGGVAYGNSATASGSTIYNNLMGLGKLVSGSSNTFSGGNAAGNVGNTSNTAGSGTTIYNNVDVSQFTNNGGSTVNNGIYFAGGDASGATLANGSNKGFVYGDIINYVRAGFTNGGAYFGNVFGGNGFGMTQAGLTTVTGTSSVAYASGAAADAAAQSKATSGHIGNAYTWMKAGNVMSAQSLYAYDLAGSCTGYDQGNATIEAGTAPGQPIGANGEVASASPAASSGAIGGTGLVYGNLYNANSSSLTPSSTAMTTGNKVPFIINNDTYNGLSDYNGIELAGGGQYGINSDHTGTYMMTGNSTVLQNNALVGYSYASAYTGYQWGDCVMVANLSISNTFQAGRDMEARWGNSTLISNNGCVEYFIGGSWGTYYTAGNATTMVYNGRFNGASGGSYNSGEGYSSGAILTGNSEMDVYGGNFSTATSLNGGAGLNSSSNAMTINGNSSLFINLSGPNGSTFKAPSKVTIGAGSASTSGNKVGSGSNSSINLLVVLPENPDPSLAAAMASNTFYGDGSTSSSNTNVGSINIDATVWGNESGATGTIGNLYGTNYIQGLKFPTNITIGNGITVAGGISSGNASDNYTNTIVSGTSNQAVLTLGDQTTGAPITINGTVENFTSATLAANTDLTVQGSLLNGGGATAANHAATYSNFGSLTMGDNAQLTMAMNGSTSPVISASKLTVGKNNIISTPYTQSAGMINLSDLDMSKGNIVWQPTGTAPSGPTTSYSGAYWGSQKGYPVLTLNGGNSATGITQITPQNFSGVDKTNNYAFLGDYTTASVTSPTSPSYIAYAVPGQIRQFTTTGDANTGAWKYNLSGISTGTPTTGTAMSAWASVASGTSSSTITLMYTMGYASSQADPFSFATTSPYYVKSRTASGYDGRVINSYPSVNPNFDSSTGVTGATRSFSTSDYFVGNQQDGSNDQATYGSYIIENAATDNTQSVTAGNIIISDSTAQSLTQAQLEKLVKMSGVGVMSDVTLPSNVLSEINAGLASGQAYLTIPVAWSNGAASATTTLTIMPDHATIASDGQTALDAYDASLTVGQANAITGAIDSTTPANGVNNYTKAIAVSADGTVSAPTLSNASTLIPALQAVNATTSLTATYTFGSLSMNALLQISAGSLQFTSAPTSAEFGTLSVSNKTLVAYPIYDKTLTVTDTRTGSENTGWSLTVAETSPMVEVDSNGNTIAGGNSLAGDLQYNGTTLTSTPTLVYSAAAGSGDGVYNISSNWGSATQTGISLNVPVSAQHVGTYQGQLTWTLTSAPGN